MLLGLPPGLLAQVVSSQLSDFKLRGSSPCINTYPAKKKKKKRLLGFDADPPTIADALFTCEL